LTAGEFECKPGPVCAGGSGGRAENSDNKNSNFLPLQGTTLGWELEKIEEVVEWLGQRGVATEEYPFAQDKELGIWTAPGGDKVAWLKHPAGNILGISQPARGRTE
jgi:hypothetical protein